MSEPKSALRSAMDAAGAGHLADDTSAVPGTSIADLQREPRKSIFTTPVVAVEPVGDQPVTHQGNDPGFSANNAPYIDLFRILRLAYDQASVGKGKERHATGPVGIRTWDKQPIIEIGRMVGPGYASGQVMKKVQEAVTMAGNGNYAGAKAEALGAVVYAAALHKLLEEIEAANAPI